VHPLRREQRELKLQLDRALVVLGHEGVDDVPRDLRSGRRHGCAGAAQLQRRQQHLHGGEIAGVPGSIDLDDEPRHPRQIARALLDELHAGKLGERDGVGNGHVGAGAGIEIERDGELGLAPDRFEIGDEIGLCGRAGERTHRRQHLHRRGAEFLRQVRQLDRGPEGRVRDTDHDRHAAVDELDRVPDQGLAMFEAEISVFLGLDAGGDDHGGAAVGDDVIDLPPQRGPVDLEIGRERRERRNDQSGVHHLECPRAKAPALLHRAFPSAQRRRCPRSRRDQRRLMQR
jgi:hypothetical protein